MDANPATAVKLGWLWFDDDPKTTLQEKVIVAAHRFQQKFGQAPRLCYVNERELMQEQTTAGLKVTTAKYVLPGHFLFVIEAAAPAA